MKEVKELAGKFKPYFGLKGKALTNSLVALFIFLGNIGASFLMVGINTAFASLLGILSMPGLTYTAFLMEVGYCLLAVVQYATVRVINWGLASWLGDRLDHDMNQSLIDRWIDKKSFYGIKFVEKHNKNAINPANILGQDISNITSSATSLYDSLVQRFFDFAIGAYFLWQYSAPLTVAISTMSFAIPGYMFIGALVYAVGYHFVISILDQKLKANNSDLRAKQDNFLAHLHHVNEHAESVALKKGGAKEKKELKSSLARFAQIKSSSRKTSGLITFFQVIHDSLHYMFGLALSAPSIIAGIIDSTMAFSISDYFSSVVKLFTWRKDKTETITSMNVSLNRLTTFEELMGQWEKVQVNPAWRLSTGGQAIATSGITVNKPNGDEILSNISFSIPQGKATVLQGSSGIGKTTLFRCLAGLWPHVQGNLVLPGHGKVEELKVHYIPQKPYFPYRGKLIEAIAYPGSKLDQSQHKLAVTLMKAFGFQEQIIQDLGKVDEWDKRLSGGEQQRIAIISAIIQQPEILFMDEGTSALDHATKLKVEKALKQYLKNTTIVAIDHNPIAKESKGYQPFFDHKLSLNKAQSTTSQPARIKASLKPY
jgi:vitamin B12/bleomycin/antimicrobial peptide transport system ATP-binding/permease protein